EGGHVSFLQALRARLKRNVVPDPFQRLLPTTIALRAANYGHEADDDCGSSERQQCSQQQGHPETGGAGVAAHLLQLTFFEALEHHPRPSGNGEARLKDANNSPITL